ncbi:MAG TPA: hypothetical protein VGF94_08145 [Kofleriaceae bacterium]|jgi:hypothetical protein
MTFVPRAPLVAKVVDPTAERVRQNHEARLGDVERALIAAPPGAGAYLGRQVFAASSTYVPARGCKCVVVRMVSGGNGGGGATGNVSGASAAAGGNGGWCVEFHVTSSSEIVGGPAVVGAAGIAGTAGGGTGGAGGATSLAVNGKTWTAPTSSGGPGAGSTSGNASVFNTQPSAPVGSFDSMSLVLGRPGFMLGATWLAGGGGSSPFGMGGADTQGVANAGIGYGAGGSGAAATTASRAGAAGTGGLIIVDEFGA